MKRMHIKDAEAAGFTIDHHAGGRPIAYKGARFRTDEWVECYTEFETELMNLLVEVKSRTSMSDVLRRDIDAALNKHKDKPLEVPLPPSIWWYLKQRGIASTADLVQHTANEILRLPNIGYARLRRIEQALAEIGLSLQS